MTFKHFLLSKRNLRLAQQIKNKHETGNCSQLLTLITDVIKTYHLYMFNSMPNQVNCLSLQYL